MLPELNLFGITVPMYDFWNGISILAMLLYFFLHAKQFIEIVPLCQAQTNSKKKYIYGVLMLFLFVAVAFLLFRLLNPLFGKWFTKGNANYYGSLTAWMIAFIGLPFIFKISPLKVNDLFAPALPLQLFFAKLACFFHGCCHSYELASGFYYNQTTKRYEFPVQLIEAAVAIILLIGLLIFRRKTKHIGLVFPVYLTAYSASRFATEFLRGDLPAIVWFLDAYQILSVIFFIFGLLFTIWIIRFGNYKN